MIHFLLVVSKQGKPRISRFFTHQKDQLSTQNAVSKLCLTDGKQEGFVNYKDVVLVYKLYVNLWFITGVSQDENELAILELFQNLVETLNIYFGKVLYALWSKTSIVFRGRCVAARRYIYYFDI
ncbi:AP-4 complex subunit sigma-1-like isoform X3 [Ostrea edulis]|uniref:AP-4 complex subunit sigma-1-like isoform X3 n=1 Tax=Ostrea edulis TaxID=37623 RepID=UPI0024AEC64F|nr:AP-4 complex subunit sigma-1-like isoform X3 [Ostrea edulis]